MFHEVFGHCAMLTHRAFADFSQKVGSLAVRLSELDKVKLMRLYWFTVEFGLIDSKKGPLSMALGSYRSKNEVVYSLESPIPRRHPFDPLTILQTPYRHDALQLNYFIIDKIERLYEIFKEDNLRHLFSQVDDLGLLPGSWPVDTVLTNNRARSDTIGSGFDIPRQRAARAVKTDRRSSPHVFKRYPLSIMRHAINQSSAFPTAITTTPNSGLESWTPMKP